MSGYRKERLEKQIRMIVAESILKDIKDPRIGFVTVTDVKLNKDKSLTLISVSILGDEKAKKKSMNGLNAARGFFQFKIGKGIKMRNTPKITFKLDTSMEYGSNMESVFDKLKKERQDENPKSE